MVRSCFKWRHVDGNQKLLGSIKVSELAGKASDGTKLAQFNGAYTFRYVYHDGAVFGIGSSSHPRALIWNDIPNCCWVLSCSIGATRLLTCNSTMCTVPHDGWEPKSATFEFVHGLDCEPFAPRSINELQNLLVCYGVELAKFGTSSVFHKTLKELWWETQKGVCAFRVLNGALRRVISCLRLTVYCIIDGTRFELREEEEIRGDGQKIDLFKERQSIMKKLYKNETWRDGIARALAIDLQVRNASSFRVSSHSEADMCFESHYPSLLNSCIMHDISIEIQLPIDGIDDPRLGQRFVIEEQSLFGPCWQRSHHWRWVESYNMDEIMKSRTLCPEILAWRRRKGS